ncbi:MAG: hypothetical protein JO257_38135 [Deltaproteobacteria bacterium]|nr:hypothetical protein [Deltaproteobacteria bacterium]
MRWFVLAMLAACISPYNASTLPPSGVRLSCVDAWVEATTRPEAEGPVVVVHVGNRCDHSARVDLGSLKVVGLDEQGATWPLSPYDPRHEIEPRRMDALAWGEEWIEFHAPVHGASLASVDVDVGSIEALGEARWIRVVVPR